MHLLMFLEALGGLGLLVLGMKTMSEGLQRLAGEKLRRFLEKLAGNRFSAVLLGGCLTALLRSGGAAAIITIGFVNAGLLSLYQALGMLIGTGLGTAFAVQLFTLKIHFVAAPGIFAGAILKFFSRRRRWVHLGEVILGFSLLFFGLHMMEYHFSPLKESGFLAAWHSYLPAWNLVHVLVGAALAFFVQSGSTAVAIVIAMASGGLLPVEPAVAMVLGEMLGTVGLAAIGAINGTMAARRAVLIYFIMALCLLLVTLLLFPWFLRLVLLVTPDNGALAAVLSDRFSPAHAQLTGEMLFRFLANAHTLFSTIGVLLLLPLVGFFTRSASGILPGRDRGMDTESRLQYIDFRVVDTPVIAYSQTRNEIRRMAELTQSMYLDMMALFEGYDARKAAAVAQREGVLDALQKDIAGFLVTMARHPLPPQIAVEIPVMLQTVSSLEGIGDHVETILECMRRKKEGNVYFSEAAMNEIRGMGSKAADMVDLVVKALGDPRNTPVDKAASQLDSIRKVRTGLKKMHAARLSSGSCTVIAGLLYMDIITALERISDLSMEIIEDQRGTG